MKYLAWVAKKLRRGCAKIQLEPAGGKYQAVFERAGKSSLVEYHSRWEWPRDTWLSRRRNQIGS